MRLNLIVLALAITTGITAGCQKSQPAQSQVSQPNVAAPAEAVTETTQAPATAAQLTTQPVSTTSSEQPAKAKTDACALLSNKEVQKIQGESIKETKLTARSDGGFSISQCFFTLPTFTNSISLAVTQRSDDQSARDPRMFWRDIFHRSEEKEREKEREKGYKKEEEEEVKPEKVSGVGEEAFWMGSRVGGALYVLKGNSYVRVSVGGAADQATRIKKSKTLAQKAIARL